MNNSLGFCALCHNFNWLDDYLCPVCTSALKAVTYKAVSSCSCVSCGAPLFHADSSCQCNAKGPLVVRVGLYTKEMQEIVVRYKKAHVKLLCFALATLLTDVLKGYRNLIIVPVPCSIPSRRARGWDQMITIAKTITRTNAYTLGLLLERRGKGAQKNLSRASRLTAAPASYYVKAKQLQIYAQAIDSCDALVVVDDVMTTGATLYTCIAKLEQVIHKPIFGLCIAMD